MDRSKRPLSARSTGASKKKKTTRGGNPGDGVAKPAFSSLLLAASLRLENKVQTADEIATWRNSVGQVEPSDRTYAIQSAVAKSAQGKELTPQHLLFSCLDSVREQYEYEHGNSFQFDSDLDQYRKTQCPRQQLLPNHLILIVAQFLADDLSSLCNMAATCRHWHTVLNQETFWKYYCVRNLDCQNGRFTEKLLTTISNPRVKPTLRTVVPLVKAGAKVSAAHGLRQVTPLLFACFHGHLKVAQWLLSQNASLESKTACGKNALMMACWGGHVAIVEWLLSLPAALSQALFDSRDLLGNTPLLCAAMRGSKSVCVLLTSKRGADPLAEMNNDGRTALLWASFGSHVDLMEWLISQGADTSTTSKCGESPVLCAALGGSPNTVKALELLETTGASLHEVNETNENCLTMAAYNNNPDLIDWLLKKGCKPLKSIYGQTPLHIAVLNDNQKVAAKLASVDPSLACCDKFGSNPTDLRALLCALCNKQPDRVKEILPRLTGVVLHLSPCKTRTSLNLTDVEMRLLCEALKSNAQVKKVVLINTSIGMKKCEAAIAAVLAQNKSITEFVLGHTHAHDVPTRISQLLKRNLEAAQQ